ncbi:MAG: regulatory protein RecX [Clostridia bacterium]|nr:regulatory protein RecX [Clostridia bacterium]
MEKEIYYIVERIKKTPNGRIYCIRSSMGTTFEMLVSEEQYARFDIKEGDRIDDEHFLKIREEMIFDNARRHAFTILSYGENNRKSLIQKLRAKGYSPDVCEKIADYMEHRGYIDEKKQIGLLCDTYLRKKFGKLKIKSELIAKGYKREDVEEYVAEHLADVNFAENCAFIIENKYFPLPKDPKEIAKMMGALMKYGYTIGDIKEAIRIVMEREKEKAEAGKDNDDE